MLNFLKRAYAEIHVDRAVRNLEKIRTLLEEKTELMAVIKANAYGHDDETMSRVYEAHGVKYFAVSNIHEAQRLRKFGIKSQILILGYTDPEYAEELSSSDIVTSIISKEYAQNLNNFAKQPVRCHIAIDTGMGRIGLKHSSADEYVREIKEIMLLPNIKVEGIFTHLSVADSDDPDDAAYTQNQQNIFKEIKNCLTANNIFLKHTHYLNSAGGTYYTDEESTLARFGIMLYGLYPNPKLRLPIELEPVMDLKAEIVHVKETAPGTYIGYGRTFCTVHPMKIATVTIGYADGYSRLLSEHAEVLVNGKRAKIVGRICMDQLMIDVTGIDADMGDIVTLIGKDGNETITADDLAMLYGTIGYEIVCGISKRIPRVIVDDGKIIDVLEY